MRKYLQFFNLFRKQTALSLAVLVVAALLFTTFIATTISNLYTQVDEMMMLESETLETFLERARNRDRTFLQFWSEDWENYINQNPDLGANELIQKFVSRRLVFFPELFPTSVIVFMKYDDEIIYFGYDGEAYQGYYDAIKKLDLPQEETEIIINDEDITFGQGDRFFLQSTVLQCPEGHDLFLYLGFHEQVLYDNYIASLNTEDLFFLEQVLQKIYIVSFVFVLFIIAYGIFLLYIIRCFLNKTEDNLNQLGRTLDGIVESGYVTEEEIKEVRKKE